MSRGQVALAAQFRGAGALENEIVERIAADPGIALAEILIGGTASVPSVQRELGKLEQAGLVKRQEVGREVRLYLTKAGRGPGPDAILGPTARDILRYLRSHPDANVLAISSKTGHSPRLVAGHLRRLRLEGWVTARGAAWRTDDARVDEALAKPAALPYLRPFPPLQGYAPIGIVRGAPARGPDSLRWAFQAAFESSPRADEIALKVEEAFLRPKPSGVTPLRVSLCRSFASLDVLPPERESLLGFVDELLAPQGDGWRRSIVTRASVAVYPISGAEDFWTSEDLFQWCAAQVKQAATGGSWVQARGRAALLLGEADWRAPDAPPLVDTVEREWAQHAQDDGPGRMAFLTELVLAAHAWGLERGLPLDRLEPSRRDVLAAWKLLLLATSLVLAGRPPGGVLSRLRHVAREQTHPPPDAVEELVRCWPRQWVPHLAAHLLEHAGLDDVGEAALLLEASRVHAEQRDYQYARYWLRWMPRTVTQSRPDLWQEKSRMMQALAQMEAAEVVPLASPS